VKSWAKPNDQDTEEASIGARKLRGPRRDARFNVVLGNHPPYAITTTRDHTLMIVGGLREAGFDTVMNYDEALPNRINLYYDYLHNQAEVEHFRSLRARGVKYALITTEIMTADTINGVGDETARKRIEMTRAVAESAEFLWVMHEPSIPQYATLAASKKCHHLPLGYSKCIEEIKYYAYNERDFDFLFFGLLTDYRRERLAALRQRGHKVAHVYNIPAFIRNSMIERTRINLILRQTRDWTQPAVGRLVYLVSNGCAVIAEKTLNGAPYEPYAIAVDPDKFVDECERVLLSEPFWDTAAKNQSLLKKRLPMAEIMSLLVERTLRTT